jgi:predicted DCC family thiol-disulfide oxidoreductase YuxK
MKLLYVLFDGECSLCRRCRAWLARQPAFLELCFLPFPSTEVSRRFPGIEALHPEEQLLVVSDEGGVYRGSQAWVMCLYALRDYRQWSQRLAHPAFLPWARRVCELLSENRFQVSRWLAAILLAWTRRYVAVTPALFARSSTSLRLAAISRHSPPLHAHDFTSFEGFCRTHSL